jgi:uncharacterized protein (TIGR03437 family)
VTVTSNAANSPLIIPVQLDVPAQGAPFSFFGGAVFNAVAPSSGPNVLAQGAIVSLFGEQLSLSAPQGAATLPLGTTLAATSVFVNGQPAPIFYASYDQVNFQIPYNAAIGDGTIRVDRSGQRGNSISVTIVKAAPRILSLGIKDYGIIVNQDGSFPIPATPGIASHPAKAGDVLVIYAVGLGPTNPPVASGAGAPATPPLATVASTNKVVFGGGGFFGDGVVATPSFVGLTPNFVGLYQINVTVPAGTQRGDSIGLYLAGDDGPSNRVTIAIQ